MLSAQVPNYVPSNGLLGWWPFTGNANDQSVNGNNGNVSGATLSSDRFNNSNQAYYFDGIDNIIIIANEENFDIPIDSSLSISAWFNSFELSTGGRKLITKYQEYDDAFGLDLLNSKFNLGLKDGSWYLFTSDSSIVINEWYHFVSVFDNANDQVRLYVNGNLIFTQTFTGNIGNSSAPLTFGDFNNNTWPGAASEKFKGLIDDVGIWNRVLDGQEITNLYNSGTCTQTIYDTITTNITVYDTIITNINVYDTITVTNHINIYDTITTINTVTVYDTITTTNFISVTDTLIINTTLGLAPNQQQNTIKVYPNPANSHISIHTGDFALMAGYRIKIQNAIAQDVYNELITQQEYFIDLSTWSGNGTYFVHIIDNLGNTVDIKKIILQ